MTHLGLQLLRRALGDDRTGIDDRQSVAQLVCLLEVLRRQEDGRPGVVDAAHLIPDRQPRRGIKARGRLVEEEDLGRVDERAREVQPALHPPRVGLRTAIGRVAQADELEQFRRAQPCLRPADSVQAALKLEQLAPTLHGIEPDLLQRHADPPAHLRRIRDHIDAGDARAAIGRR